MFLNGVCFIGHDLILIYIRGAKKNGKSFRMLEKNIFQDSTRGNFNSWCVSISLKTVNKNKHRYSGGVTHLSKGFRMLDLLSCSRRFVLPISKASQSQQLALYTTLDFCVRFKRSL